VESNRTWSLEQIENNLCRHFLKKLTLYLQTGFQSFQQDFLDRLAYLGQVIECGGEKGVFETIAPDGSLILKKADGSLKKISSGDLFIS
jgi:biotin-(acetyl-CoA carboxylase) ligase